MTHANAQSRYLKTWRQRHWIQSIFAPQAHVLQAVTQSGGLASGLGETRVDALNRALGETLEAIAQTRGAMAAGIDGTAAGQDPATTRMRAWLEAVERVEISHWWQGNRPVRMIDPLWLRQVGWDTWIRKMRSGAYARRETRLWRLDSPVAAKVVVCKTNSPSGQDPILGFGAGVTLQDAIGHALREALLMEINLIEVLAVRGGYSTTDTRPIEMRVTEYGRRCAELLSGDGPARSQMRGPSQLLEMDAADFSHQTFDEGWSVWSCTLPDPVFRRSRGAGPFMNTPITRGAA